MQDFPSKTKQEDVGSGKNRTWHKGVLWDVGGLCKCRQQQHCHKTCCIAHHTARPNPAPSTLTLIRFFCKFKQNHRSRRTLKERSWNQKKKSICDCYRSKTSRPSSSFCLQDLAYPRSCCFQFFPVPPFSPKGKQINTWWCRSIWAEEMLDAAANVSLAWPLLLLLLHNHFNQNVWQQTPAAQCAKAPGNNNPHQLARLISLSFAINPFA